MSGHTVLTDVLILKVTTRTAYVSDSKNQRERKRERVVEFQLLFLTLSLQLLGSEPCAALVTKL